MGKSGKTLAGIFLAVVTVPFLVYVMHTGSRTNMQQDFSVTNPVTQEPSLPQDTVLAYRVLHEGLHIPWDIAFLPNDALLVTERSGTLKEIAPDGTTVAIPVSGVRHAGEGGLMGIALHPDFANNRLLYLYISREVNGGTVNSVERYRYDDSSLSERKVVVGDIPGAIYHDGGRIAFGPDGYLYIATGDATQPDLSQDVQSLAGKILRVTEAGDPAPGNPFHSLVYSLGHRNPQGIAWDSNGVLWSTEHGRSGIFSGLDELNRIERAGNYGWSDLQGDDRQHGFVAPTLHSGSDTWAPASIAIVEDRIFFGGLRGEALYEVTQENGVPVLQEYFKGVFGRIRTVAVSPDGTSLYVTTSNRDGRGSVRDGDDKIIQVTGL